MITIDMDLLRRAQSEGCSSHGEDHIENAVYVSIDDGRPTHVAIVPYGTAWSICSDQEDALALADVLAAAARDWAARKAAGG